MENWLLAVILSLDTLFACMAYGVKRIKIPPRSAAVIAAAGAGCLLLSAVAGELIGRLIPEQMIRYLGFSVLIVMGMLSIFQSLLKEMARKEPTLRFHLSECSFVLSVCLDETQADLDRSKRLSAKEALLLGFTLSADSLLGGFSIRTTPSALCLVGIFSFGLGMAAVLVGTAAGRFLCRNKEQNLSWISGLLLIGVAFLKI